MRIYEHSNELPGGSFKEMHLCWGPEVHFMMKVRGKEKIL